MTRQIILRSEGKEGKVAKDLDGSGNNVLSDNTEHKSEEAGSSNDEVTKERASKEKPARNKGKLIVDATVADQMIAYATDLGLLSRSREESERIIDELCRVLSVKDKPRTYRRKARRQYLKLAKNRNKSNKEIRKPNLNGNRALISSESSFITSFKSKGGNILWLIELSAGL